MTDTRTDHPWATTNPDEPLAEGGAWLQDLITAVNYLRRGIRPGFTVWDAIAEAIRWWNEEQLATGGALAPELCEGFWEWDDPLRETLRGLIDLVDHSQNLDTATVIQQAIRRGPPSWAPASTSGTPGPSDPESIEQSPCTRDVTLKL